jgi:hypothetical protein
MTLIQEIIIVDDGSELPLESIFPKELAAAAKVRFIRHEGHVGLTPSRQDGGNMATGDVLFRQLDRTPIFKEISVNPKRIVVPRTTNMIIWTSGKLTQWMVWVWVGVACMTWDGF